MKKQLLHMRKISGIHLVDKGAAHMPQVLVVKRDNNSEEQTMSLEARIAKAIAVILKEEGMAPEKTPEQRLEASLEGLPDVQRNAIMAAVAALHQAPPPVPVPVVEAPPAVIPEKQEGAPVDEEAEPEKQDEEEEPEKADDVVEPEKQDEEEEPEKADDKGEDAAMKRNIAKALAKMDPSSRTVIEGLVQQNVNLTKRLDSSEEVIAKNEADKALAIEVGVAKRFKYFKGDINKRAKLLLSVKKNQGKEDYDELVASYKSADELARKGLGNMAGTSRSDDPDASDNAAEKLEEMAKALVEKGESKTFEQAYGDVVKRNPKLYNQAEQERRDMLQ